MKIVVGCPTYKRDWILDHWISCFYRQSIPISEIGFIFEVSSKDVKTISKLQKWKNLDQRIPYFQILVRDDLPHFEHNNHGRQWTLSKYVNMVELRNSLLSKVRDIEPDYYFSLDSDILIQNPNTLEFLISHIKEGADAVSPLMFMTPVGTDFPSVMTWRNDGTEKAFREQEYPIGKFFKADVIMAAKMMSKDVYENINYEIHLQGEDLGWALNCKKQGYELYSASYIYAPHIMSELMYADFIKNGDSRKKVYQLV